MQSVHISENQWQINPGWKWVSNPENLRSSASHSWSGGAVRLLDLYLNIFIINEYYF